MLSEATVTNLLNVLPVDVELSNLISWLRDFIPSILRVTPQSLKHVVSWAIDSIQYVFFSFEVPLGYQLFLKQF
jgi:hypothetical protein